MNNLTLIFTLTLFFHLGISHSSDLKYGKCPSKKCENVKISYPFRIIDQQNDYCGYPGFDVSCPDNKFPFLNISGNSYVIKQIGYNTQSFRVTNSVFMDSTEIPNCSNSIRNLTLQDSVFKFRQNYSEIDLLVNCPGSNLLKCQGLAMFGDDPKGKCGGVVSVPVEEGGFRNGDVSRVMRNGIELKWTGNNCSDCVRTGGQCGFDQNINEFQCFCYDRPHALHCTPRKRNLGLIIIGLSIAASIILLTALLIWWYRKNIQFVRPRFVSRSTSLDRCSSDLEKGNLYFGVPLFSYTELVEATDNFNASRELGDGGFGTVYYGTLKDGREVAVKRLYEKNYKRVEQFMNEVQILTCLRHLNLVSLYGCTSHHSRELLLVYEYVPNGTVADHLHGDKVKSGLCLPWKVRMRIAIETASALSYLHASDIIHRDIKTNNILLDGNFGVKVADFGLSRLFPTDVTHVSTAPQGTPGYVDPEYHQCYQLTNKSDVYSFGVVLVELISSLPAVDMNRQRHEINLSNYAMNRIQRRACTELVDHELGFTSDFRVRKMTTSIAELAFRCLQHDKEFRPTMDEVLEALRRIEATDYEALKDEESKEDSRVGEKDEVQLLSKHKLYESSISVTDKWNSSSSTTTTATGHSSTSN